MESTIGSLVSLFERERAEQRPLALGIVLHTEGSTYRKPGALMLVSSGDEEAGLLSGGCLEADLREHACTVLKSGKPCVVNYDLRDSANSLWGLGLGCEGAMRIFLMRLSAYNDWQPLAHLAHCLERHVRTAVGIVVESMSEALPVGTVFVPAPEHNGRRSAAAVPLALLRTLEASARTGRPAWIEEPVLPQGMTDAPKIFALPLSLPPRILLLGAGPDAMPVVDFGSALGWKITVADHRPGYAQIKRFPGAERIVLARPEEIPHVIDLSAFSAAVVMSHHLLSDLLYLRAIAQSSIGFVGLLGPAARRDLLTAELGSQASSLVGRLRAPIGLALGGRAPESIALAIIAQIHAFVHGTKHSTSDDFTV